MDPKTPVLRLCALAAVLLALAPGRAAADPAAIFASNYNGGNNNVSAYDATGAAATGYTAPTGFRNPEGVAYNPAGRNPGNQRDRTLLENVPRGLNFH